MKYFIYSVILFLSFFIFHSCKDKDVDEIVIALKPESFQIMANVGDYIIIETKVQSNSKLNKFVINQTINSQQSTVILDSLISVKSFNFDYSYFVPDIDVSLSNEIKLVFTFIDDNGNSQKRTKIIIVNKEDEVDEPLSEILGSEMFSRLASNKNAFDLKSLQPLNYETADSSIRYIEDYSFDTTSVKVDTLSHKWVSPAGLKFLKYNSFDYANASSQSIKDSYLSGIETDFIDHIEEGDIILTYLSKADEGHEFYAIKIMYIIDNDGVEEDRYVFNIKH